MVHAPATPTALAPCLPPLAPGITLAPLLWRPGNRRMPVLGGHPTVSRWSDLGQGMGSTQATVVERVPGQSRGAPPCCHAAQPQEQLKVRAGPPCALCDCGGAWGPAGSQASGQAGRDSPSNADCTLLPPH